MIKQAAADFNIDLEGSFIVGDSYRDILCGRNAGISTIGVKTGDGCKSTPAEPDFLTANLDEAVDIIIKG